MSEATNTTAPTGKLELAAFDARDISTVAGFYQQLTGWERVREVEDWITLQAPDGQQVGFQQVPDHAPSTWPTQERPQQFHLDLLVDGHQDAAERAVGLGATRLADGESWVTLADPAGHPFDLCQRDGFEGVGLYAVTIDTPDASGLAGFYADLLGLEVTYDGPEGALVAGEVDGVAKSLMFQQVADFNPPRWGDPARPQQAHLDVIVEDAAALEAVSARVLGRGATLLGTGGDDYRGFIDPSGHPFDLSIP